MSARMRRLLLEGDVTGRYGGLTDSDAGYRLTMALAAGCSQPGRAWMPADFFQALLYTPTAGGAWARALRERKGTDYAGAKLAAMLDKARRLVLDTPVITCRQDALEEIEAVRQVVEAQLASFTSSDSVCLSVRTAVADLEVPGCSREIAAP
ncbi:hypothetical protein SHJG_0048 [Streptomyces hygroscopicus subsp. jinggangensis 5008]|nr:hypothetical protein SHJG_0048 [Streptomyces hygroscopicus subsp. jinggangensis 5008]AGF59716.1 hypothetical protein SHJGH_0050 [Streptomyces hygroscopicus subsp. jinggangensis TL01]